MTRIGRGKEDRTTTDKLFDAANIFTESLSMKRSLGDKFEECYTDFEMTELRKQRQELVKRWNSQMAQVISAFAAATFLKDEIHRIDDMLGNEFDSPQDILKGSNID